MNIWKLTGNVFTSVAQVVGVATNTVSGSADALNIVVEVASHKASLLRAEVIGSKEEQERQLIAAEQRGIRNRLIDAQERELEHIAFLENNPDLALLLKS
ncbi:MAG: hypothetical protein COA63_014025 [Methylophaga sp.]|nr:hypothetical protein [Methylophaga sp.]